MKKIYLFCNAGMSTSLVASKMQDVANQHQLPIEVKAFSDAKLASTVEEHHPDVILLGPQVKFKYEETKKKYEPQGIPVAVIDLEDYGNVNGERILKRAIKLLKEKGGK
ncbi:PTS sugar transporter subunit IIB [Streptococcus cuniculi]|uniref:PTS sugar transporter subunit IIB n=1 Tax=Streptococcus cuniculi TaxID=1432788 RepID=A0A1Q8EAW9_9STRE|nr:PTS sugar transporter subunit IIB [Streptococcus cuniculi]OLF48931.1 PTS sugar transporter subunit IIB [Streptococcus cuniculi]